MATALWTAVSGANAQAIHVDIISNNLANSDTIGFKKDQPTFKESISLYESPEIALDPALQMPRIPSQTRDFFPLDAKASSHVVVSGTPTNFKQGYFKVTHAPLDLALSSPELITGFFVVGTPSGIRYTRQGSFKLAMDGRLVTADGYPVLSSEKRTLATAPPTTAVQPSQDGLATQGRVGAEQLAIQARAINLRDVGANIHVAENGEVYAGDQLVTQLAIVEFNDSKRLHKDGGSLFENADPANVRGGVVETVVKQGVLESSNVNPVEEMTNLIKANRAFEMDLKAMKTFDQIMGREANDIGKL